VETTQIYLDVPRPSSPSKKSVSLRNCQISNSEISLLHPLTEFGDKLKLPTGALSGVTLLAQLLRKLVDVLA